LLRAYAYFLTYSIVVKIIVNVAYVWAFFSQSRQSLVDRCIAGSTDQDVKDICDAEFDTGKWTVLANVVISLIIQVCEFCFSPVICENEVSRCGCHINSFLLKGTAYIVTSYAKKLKDEQAWRSGPGVAPLDTAGSKYARVRGEDQIPLSGASYAYSDANHSFGSAASRHTTASV
jgi:hypothetical protein